MGELNPELVEAYRATDAKIRELDSIRHAIRLQIQDALGDDETGTVNGKPVIRWTTVSTRRLSQTLVQKRFSPDELSDCWTYNETRRFTLVWDKP